MEYLAQHIESLIFTAQGPISYAEIKAALEDSFDTKLKKADIEKAIRQVMEKYQSNNFSFEVVEIAQGYQFFTKGAYHQTVGSRMKQTAKKRLSKAALETLAVIAYKQPVVKSEVEKIRGVSCDYTIHKLLEKELIAIIGRSEGPGRPLLYATSQKFMDYFGLKDISELPKPKDFKLPEDEIGSAAPIEEELTEEQREQQVADMEEMAAEVVDAILNEERETNDTSPIPEPPAEIDVAAEIIEPESPSNSEEILEEDEPEAAIDDEPQADMAADDPDVEDRLVVSGEAIDEKKEEDKTFYYSFRNTSSKTPIDIVEPIQEELAEPVDMLTETIVEDKVVQVEEVTVDDLFTGEDPIADAAFNEEATTMEAEVGDRPSEDEPVIVEITGEDLPIADSLEDESQPYTIVNTPPFDPDSAVAVPPPAVDTSPVEQADLPPATEEVPPPATPPVDVATEEEAPASAKKPRKKSFFQRVKEKVVVYLRKLTLADIRFIGEDDEA